jgi:hypothetical protein
MADDADAKQARSRDNRKYWAAMVAWRNARIEELCKQGVKYGDAKLRGHTEAAERWAAGWAFGLESVFRPPAEEKPVPAEETVVDGPPSENPPSEPVEAEEAPEVIEMLAGRDSDKPVDMVRDTLWVYQNLGRGKVKPEDAPSLGAWNLLAWAKDYRSRFFEQILPKAMAAQSKGTDDEDASRREKLAVGEIKKVLSQLQELATEKET